MRSELDVSLSNSASNHALGDIPRRTAKRFPNKLAIVEDDFRITFKQLNDYIDKVSAYFYYDLNLRKGDTILIMSRNCWQFPVISFAAARIGVITVPVNYMLGKKELSYVLDHCEARVIFVEDIYAEVIDEAILAIDHPIQKRICLDLNGKQLGKQWMYFDRCLQHDHIQPPYVEVLDTDFIRMMYTSGTESLPKGVLLTSKCLMWQYMSCTVSGGMSASDRELHSFPLYHCAQLDNFLSVDIYLGATSYIIRKFDPEIVLGLLEKEKITKLFCPPTAWISILNSPSFDTTDLSALNKIYYGASMMPKVVVNTLKAKLPEIQFYQFYGQTEMASLATVLSPEDHLTHPSSVGLPALNVETQIVDSNGRVLSHGEIGEIVHRSPHVTLGYYKNQQSTADAFKDGWFHSGDLGYFDESGYLYVVDRLKDIIKTGGESVSTKEIEDAIYMLNGVKEVAVFGIPHPKWIEVVTAVIVPKEGAQIETAKILEHCKAYLANYKIPKYIEFLSQLPKNASGKILKRDLKQKFEYLING